MTRHTSFNETDDVSEVSRRKLWLIFGNFLSQHFDGTFTVAFESLRKVGIILNKGFFKLLFDNFIINVETNEIRYFTYCCS